MPNAMSDWLERWQIPLYVLAIGAGVAVGLSLPGAKKLEVAINPALMLLLYATFLSIPLTRIGRVLRDARFLASLVVLIFLLVPVHWHCRSPHKAVSHR